MNSVSNNAGSVRPEFESSPPVRYHYMDNLRAIAMIGGIFFHAALAYSPMLSSVWLTSDVQSSSAMDAAAWFSHLFRMPLFFLIAGFFSCYLIQKRGLKGFLKNRAVRVLIPFVVFLPAVLAAFMVIIGWSLETVDNPSPMLQLIAYMSTFPDAPPPPVSTTHLWFLYNLVQFYIVYALLFRMGVMSARLFNLLSAPKFLVFVLPLLVVPALASRFAPHPAPEQFIPQLWSFGFFGVFFLVGAQFFRNQAIIDQLRPYAPWLLVTSLIMYGVLYGYFPESPTMQEAMAMAVSAPFTTKQFLMGTLEAYIAVHMTLVCLVAGKALLAKPGRVARYIADSSYWIYIIHLPLLWVIQFKLLDVDWNLWAEFAVSSLGTLAMGLLTYALFVRWTPIGWLLNGRRSSKKTKQVSEPVSAKS